MNKSSNSIIAMAVAAFLLAAGIVMIFQRGGMLAWLGVVLAAGLLLKATLRPSPRDLPISLSISVLWAVAWAAIFYYVISTWETGEVVELTIETPTGDHIARTWVMETPEALLFYYDAPSTVARALTANTPVSVMRGNEPLLFSHYTAMLTDELPESQVRDVTELMSTKYGDRNTATNIFYGLLGRSRDKTGVLITIPRGTNEP